MISIRLTSNKQKWRGMKTSLSVGVSKKLQIGFFSEDRYGPENSNFPVALVAAWQDKGAPFVGDKHIPARPFMSVGLKELLKSPLYTSKYKKAYIDILENNSDFERQYKKISIDVVPRLKKIIDRWAIPPNAPATVKEKGFNDPLINTGKMRDSVKAKVSKS
jgi:hypothetical protein